jgi:subtilisin family serine protease
MIRWFLFFVSGWVVVSLTAAQSLLSPDLSDQISRTPSEQIPVILILSQQVDLQVLTARAELLPRPERRRLVVDELKEAARLSQIGLLADLEGLEAEGRAGNIRPLWIVNAVLAQVQGDQVVRRRGLLDRHPEIVRAVWDPSRPEDRGEASIADEVDETSWGLADVGAPQVWTLGYYGQGVVVGLIDTGVDYTHPDLQNRIWVNPGEDLNNNGLVDSADWNNQDDDLNGYIDDLRGWDFDNNSPEVMDISCLGTQMAGIIAGDGTGANVTGMAPQAKVMILQRLFNNSVASFMQAQQYALDMDADLICSTVRFRWCDFPQPNYPLMRQAAEAELAAGLVHSSPVGNDALSPHQLAPVPFNISAPALCPAPWIHPSQMLVGGLSSTLASAAYDSAHRRKDNSSVGPSAWNLADVLAFNPGYQWASTWPAGYNDYPYLGNQQQGLIKPDIAAPTDVLTTHPGGQYSIAEGTQASAAHTAGALALLLSASPQASPATLARFLMTTAIDTGASGKDNQWGAGRLDALAAMNQLLYELSASPIPPVIPGEFSLSVHPNPFNGLAVASYELRVPSQVNLKIYDTAGRLVKSLVNGLKPAGQHSATFDGSGLSSGLYFVVMQATEGGLHSGEFRAVEKVVLLK